LQAKVWQTVLTAALSQMQYELILRIVMRAFKVQVAGATTA
jgi:hypothetical protein